MGAGTHLPEEGRVFVSVRDADKTAAMAGAVRDLTTMGFEIVATGGTASWLKAEGVATTLVNKVYEGRPNIVDRLKNADIALVFNTTEGANAMKDSFSLREAALMQSIPYYTTVSGCKCAAMAIRAMRKGKLEVAPLQSYFEPVE